MYEIANVEPVLRPVAPDGTIEPGDAVSEETRFGLTPLGEAFVAGYLARR